MERPDLKKYVYVAFDASFGPFIAKDEQRLWSYQKRVEKVLDAIKPGQSLDVLKHIQPASYEAFTLLASFYMEKERVAMGLIANRTVYSDDNYTVITRLNVRTG